MKQPGCALAERFAVSHLIAVGHVQVAMPGNIVYEDVHCGYCWLADQSKRCLIQVHTLTEARIVRSSRERRVHVEDDLFVSEQILNVAVLIENGERS